MNISHENVDAINAVVNVALAPEDYNPQVDKEIKAQAKKAKLPGFRPGQVPVGHIRRTYGKSILFDEINKLVNEKITNYIAENKLEVLGQPLPLEDDAQYSWDYKDNFNFKYEIGLAPAFELPFTAETEFTSYEIKADEETLADRIKNLRRSYGKMTNPEVSEEGDVLYATLKQDKEEGLEKTTSIRTDIVEDAKIKKSLVGLKKDDVVKIDVKKAFKTEDLARILGITEEEATALDVTKFELTVKNINRLEEADLNQEFFDKLFAEGEVTEEAQFTEKVKEEVENLFKQNSDQRLRNDMYTFGMEKVDVSFPEEFLKRWLKATNPSISEEELNEGFADFLNNLKWTIIENRVVTENGLEVKYDEVINLAKERIYAQIKMYNINEEPSDEQLNQFAIQLLQDREQGNRLFEEAKALKVFDHLKGLVKLNATDIEYKEFEKLA
ncbi:MULTISPECIES: trigger factor [Sphingobacterium]|jgi:trigger factor|uniref:Trigger factor n=1 Tax=Sphingobacterium multivorum TaxID=28454 RepID=A0A2X2L3R0_SPHMU|nr:MULTISPECIES: trigger factor [Sphingobacterium]HAE67840.1 trigger factor [Sphingobacterium sp.]KKO91047.1 peptidylprolyl isomerase [Sphingobacterium sp. Ag1]OFV15901.1 trigger factor [Sphingobacterium sp. HMSC13C05]QQT44394.1 trigger factor [Sphingobacterium multivorum]QQT62851.1 trigger factor [Sphingobacterium multivorum]